MGDQSMYRVVIRQRVRQDREEVIVIRQFELPFPPCPGLKISDGSDYWECGQLVEVTYELDSNMFSCFVEDMRLSADENLKDKVEGLFQEGWKAPAGVELPDQRSNDEHPAATPGELR